MFSPLNEIENQNQTKPKVSYAWIHESSITQVLSWNLSLNAAWLPTFPNRLCSECVYKWRENKTRKRGEKKWKFDEVFRVSSNSEHHQCVTTSAPAPAPATQEVITPTVPNRSIVVTWHLKTYWSIGVYFASPSLVPKWICITNTQFFHQIFWTNKFIEKVWIELIFAWSTGSTVQYPSIMELHKS